MLFVLSKEIRAAKRDKGEERLCVSLAVWKPSSPVIISPFLTAHWGKN